MMRRDRRLLIAVLFMVLAATSGAVQAWIIRLYLDAAALGHWGWFADTFGVHVPGSEPNKVCFDYCAPRLPFLAGWICIISFLAGLSTLALAWWKPKG